MNKFTLFFLFVLSLYSVGAGAEEPSFSTSLWQNLSKNSIVKYTSVYSGPSVGAPSGYTTDATGRPGGRPQMMEDDLKFGYRVNSWFTPGAGVLFQVYPAAQAGMMTRSFFLNIVDAKLVDQAGIKAYTDLRMYTPLGDIAAAQDLRLGLSNGYMLEYQFDASRWSVGSYNLVRLWSYGTSGNGRRNDFEIFLLPRVRYQITPSVSGVLGAFELLFHPYDSPGAGVTASNLSLQPGIRWDVTRNVWLNPYLSVMPANLSLDSTTLGMFMNAQVL